MTNNKEHSPDFVKGLRSSVSALFKDVQRLNGKVTELTKELHHLTDMFNKEDNWGSTAKRFLDENVATTIQLTNNTLICCTIVWVDRYTIGVKEATGRVSVLFKGAIATITPLTEAEHA